LKNTQNIGPVKDKVECRKDQKTTFN